MFSKLNNNFSNKQNIFSLVDQKLNSSNKPTDSKRKLTYEEIREIVDKENKKHSTVKMKKSK